MNIKRDNQDVGLCVGVDRFYHKDDYEPPIGVKLILYTSGGIATVGVWSDDCIGWLPLPSRPVSSRENAPIINAMNLSEQAMIQHVREQFDKLRNQLRRLGRD